MTEYALYTLKGIYFDIALISCYGPTEENEDEKNNRFYEELDEVYDRLSRHSIKIYLGDFNSKIGRETVYRPTIGKDRLYEYSNDNGQRLTINMAMSTELVISYNTWRTTLLEFDIGELIQEEVARIIKTPMNDKSPSENNISAELLKKWWKTFNKHIKIDSHR